MNTLESGPDRGRGTRNRLGLRPGWIGTIVIVLAAVSALLDADSGLQIWSELRGDLAVSSARVENLRRENEALRREIEILEAEPAAVDRAIREELDLVLPGEIVVHFESATGSGEDLSLDGGSLRWEKR